MYRAGKFTVTYVSQKGRRLAASNRQSHTASL
jgi:hypothetical protein